MKKDIHPTNYRPVVFQDLSNGETFLTKSTAKTDETIKVDGVEYPLVKVHILIALFGFCIAELVHFLQEHPTVFPLSKKTTLVRWAVYIGLISAILVFGIFEKQQFIYIQF